MLGGGGGAGGGFRFYLEDFSYELVDVRAEMTPCSQVILPLVSKGQCVNVVCFFFSEFFFYVA